MKLEGLNTLITGASQGLGKAIAAHFLQEGANTILCARSPDTLAQTRDLLLPKLMSGEIRLKDAERIVGEVT